jgi:predicted nuclease of predicted toxin-antitoxin system
MNILQFLADMNISPQTVSDLQVIGYSIIRVSGILPANSTDRVILTRARQDNLIIITQDLDFSTLVALGGYIVPSLVTIRMSDSSPEKVTDRLIQVLPQINVILPLGYSVIISDNHHRLRKLPFKTLDETNNVIEQF